MFLYLEDLIGCKTAITKTINLKNIVTVAWYKIVDVAQLNEKVFI